jgi:RNA-directed DNA polymerase
VRGNKGARTRGVDRGDYPVHSEYADVVAFLGETREPLKSRVFRPLPYGNALFPKAGQPGKFRRPGIPTATGRLDVIQVDDGFERSVELGLTA